MNNDPLYEMISEIMLTQAQHEDRLIRNVLRGVLNRDPTKADAEDIQIFKYIGQHDKYDIVYKNIVMGTMHKIRKMEDYCIETKFVPVGSD